MHTTRIVKQVSYEEFSVLTQKPLRVGSHALDVLSFGQRKLFKESDLLLPVVKERPGFIGLQANGRYAVYFRRKSEYLKIILALKTDCFEIISFMNTASLPRVQE